MTKLKPTNILKAKDAECYLTFAGKRYHFAHAKELDAKMEIDKEDAPILGRTGTAQVGSSWKGSGSMTVYRVSSVFREMALEYENTGNLIQFEIRK